MDGEFGLQTAGPEQVSPVFRAPPSLLRVQGKVLCAFDAPQGWAAGGYLEFHTALMGC